MSDTLNDTRLLAFVAAYSAAQCLTLNWIEEHPIFDEAALDAAEAADQAAV